MSDEREEHLLKLQVQHKKNIQILEEQIAKYGMAPPLHLVNQLEHEREKLADVEAEFAALTGGSPGEATQLTASGASATAGGVAVVGDGNIIVVGGMEGDITVCESDDNE